MQHIVSSAEGSHKMLLRSPWLRWGVGVLVFVLFGTIFGILNLRQNPIVTSGGNLEFTDADCYSRMTRVGMLAGLERFQRFRVEGESVFLKTHTFENFPLGTKPHTTAPMDWLILGFGGLLGAGETGLMLGGFLISGVLGLVFLLALWAVGWWKNIPFTSAALCVAATSPILLHAFAVGRPDHQSLVLLFVGFALLAELWRCVEPEALGWICAGIFWGLALWVSLFEPLILFAGVVVFHIVYRVIFSRSGGREPWRHSLFSIAIAVLIAGIAVGFEGISYPDFSPGYREDFARWAATIGELQSGKPLESLPLWAGWMGLLVPGFLGVHYFRSREVASVFLLFLYALTFALTWWHGRWSYFLVLVVVIAIPSALRCMPKAAAWCVFVASLWPLAEGVERTLFPEEKIRRETFSRQIETRDLREVGEFLREAPGRGVLAPWWMTPALVFYSGKEGIAGSSHQSLSGILATAHFFTAGEFSEARGILQKRLARYVVVGPHEYVIENSARLTGRPAPEAAIGRLLAETPSLAPDFLIPVFQNQTFQVYKVREEF